MTVAEVLPGCTSRPATYTPAVATASGPATEAAVQTLARGGNAIDAAAAAAWALSVCEPGGSGLGGQTTMLVRLADGHVRIIDGHSRAPGAVSLASVSRKRQRRGFRATTVPSTVATIGYAVARYGRLKLSETLRPAVRLAEEGYSLTHLQRRQTKWTAALLRRDPAAARIFLVNGDVPRRGQRMRQPVLARTLQRLSYAGWDDFYFGAIAHTLTSEMHAAGGLIDRSDLEYAALPQERRPLAVDIGRWRVFTAPPPAGGAQLALAWQIASELQALGISNDCLRIALATREAFCRRERHPDRPEEFDAMYLTAETARLLARQTILQQMPESSFAGDEEPGDTTHLSVTDADGNVVSLTQSIQSLFGAKVASEQLGFLYNNYLCTCPRTPHPYMLGSRCLPRSNVAPALICDSESHDAVLTLGAAGSRRITSSILQVITGVLDRGLPLADAVAAPRAHGLVSGKVWVERPALSDESLGGFRSFFNAVVVKPATDYSMGCVQAVAWTDAGVEAAADPRRDGTGIVMAEKEI